MTSQASKTLESIHVETWDQADKIFVQRWKNNLFSNGHKFGCLGIKRCLKENGRVEFLVFIEI